MAPSKNTIVEYKQSVTRRGRAKKFNDWKYSSKNPLAGKTEYSPRIK